MLTKEQAVATCRDYRYLIGNQIRNGSRITGVIEDLVVAPLDGVNQHRFLNGYKKTQDAGRAISFYEGKLFTVLLVVRSVLLRNEISAVDLERYLAETPAKELPTFAGY